MHVSQNLLVLVLCSQLNVLCVMGGLDLQCGVIEPVPSAVELHTEFTATCVLFESCIRQHVANADDMYWKFQQHRVPKEQYTKINDTAIRITVNITDELNSPLTCNVMLHGQVEHNIYGIFLNKGFPPEKPQNLTCIVHQAGKGLSDTMLCTWNPGRESHLDTRYTLKAQTLQPLYALLFVCLFYLFFPTKYFCFVLGPTIGPTVRTRKKERNGALLEWNLIPFMSRNGFIRNYTIFYQAEGGVEESITVDYANRQYILTSLGTNTMYAVHVSANTDAGSKNGSEFTFTTLKFAPGEIEAIVVPVCLGFLFTSVVTLLFCFNKRDLIKKHIWPQVPDPGNSRIANWSPDSPVRHNFSPKEQVCPEGIITDFSVINIENDNIDDYNKASDSLKKGKYTSEEHSSGIGGSSCMSSPRQSVSDSDEADSAQTTSSTVQYSSVVATSYRGQLPSAPVFTRSESTQPLLDCEERSEDQHLYGNLNGFNREGQPQNSEQGVRRPSRLYFKRPRMINEDADPSCDSLGFCPADEVTLQDSAATGTSQPDRERQSVPRNGINTSLERNETKSYVPQQNGYRAQ
ncbi:interleukin-6 receptor subunit beta-like [Acipenser oxyrinchus oxyrinchus]|uniref:Interleukin-6 receptor subunit beta-like n=1 Tax=Acipenser oxyrinchus oxyrinchus TaxID=40147 RepID=A0AAD8LVA5_ACIOX|nr:interleukin-6 receptor subunit beta-like [Acipenser oxyrinchus oxyrinchus]